MTLVGEVRAAIGAAFEAAQGAGQIDPAVRAGEVPWVVERPKRVEHGDLATNIAMALSKRLGKPPRGVAEAIARAFAGSAVVASAEVAGPGFINLRLQPGVFHGQLAEILAAGRGWGRMPA